MSGAHDVLERCGNLAHDALDVIPDLAADPQRFECCGRDEWSAYEASVRAVAEGWATIEELPSSIWPWCSSNPVTMCGSRLEVGAVAPRRRPQCHDVSQGGRRCEGKDGDALPL